MGCASISSSKSSAAAPSRHARALTPDGALVLVGGTVVALLQTATLGSLISRIGRKKFGLLIWKPSTSDLEQMKALFAAGTVRPVIDQIYPLDRTADALRHVGEGRTKGKVVVAVRA